MNWRFLPNSSIEKRKMNLALVREATEPHAYTSCLKFKGLSATTKKSVQCPPVNRTFNAVLSSTGCPLAAPTARGLQFINLAHSPAVVMWQPQLFGDAQLCWNSCGFQRKLLNNWCSLQWKPPVFSSSETRRPTHLNTLSWQLQSAKWSATSICIYIYILGLWALTH